VPLRGNDPKTRKEAVYAPDLMLQQAEAFIKRSAGRPFFLAYTTTLPHMAMQPPADELRKYQGKFAETPYTGGHGYLPHPTPRAGYAAMISRLDTEVGALRAAIEKAGVADDTIILVTSDNGPTHDVGGVDTAFFDSTAGLRGRKGSVWEGGIRVPCIAWSPKRIPAGRVIDSPAWTVDLRATFASLAAHGAAGGDGIDISPAFLRGEALPARMLYWPFPGYGGQQAVRDGDWKLVRRDLDALAKKAGEIHQLDAWQLYDLAKDPKETTDVAAAHPDVVARLAKYAYKQHAPNSEFPLPGMD
jgi:arylsulfatase A